MNRRTLLRLAAAAVGGSAATAAVVTASQYGAVGGSGSLAISTQ